MELSATEYFTKSQECLSASANGITTRIALVKVPTKNLSRKDWGGALVNRADAVNYYQKIEMSFKRDLKDLKKQNKMLFSMAK